MSIEPSVPGNGVNVFSPAKVNLYLAVTGKRGDGFHNLVSVVVPLAFGDTLSLTCGDGRNDTLEITPAPTNPSAVELPVGSENLILKAAQAYRAALKQEGLSDLPYTSVHFHLTKAIPHGAGLGGGSSNAVAALKLLQRIAVQPLSQTKLMEVAATLGSDCPLFFSGKGQIMHGRGELLTPISEVAALKVRGTRILLFKPPFGIPTAWAYKQLASNPELYDSEPEAEQRIAAWLNGDSPVQDLLYNRFEHPVLNKFVSLRVLFEQIRSEVGRDCLLSGSGSCCFLLNYTDPELQIIERLLRNAFGDAYFLEGTKIEC